MENKYEGSGIDKKKKKFFIKRWFFWILVILNWFLGLILSKNFTLLYMIASFIGSFVLFFVFGLFIWMVLKVVRKIRGK